MSRPVALVLVPPSFLNIITHLQKREISWGAMESQQAQERFEVVVHEVEARLDELRLLLPRLSCEFHSGEQFKVYLERVQAGVSELLCAQPQAAEVVQCECESAPNVEESQRQTDLSSHVVQPPDPPDSSLTVTTSPGPTVGTVTCACCHREHLEGQPPFQSCGKCIEQRLVPAVYCSVACQKEDWPAHKAWHKSVITLLENAVSPEVAQGKVHVSAASAFREAKDYARALPELLAAMELFSAGSEEWGAVVAVTWCTALAADGVSCPEESKPAWILDGALRVEMAERAVAAAPTNVEAWVMLGLSAAEGGHLRRASTAMMRAAQFATAESTRAGYLEAAQGLMQQLKRSETAERGGSAT